MRPRPEYRSTWDRIKQQELAAWQPITTPASVLACLVIIGVLFLIPALQFLGNSNSQFTLTKIYDDGIFDPSNGCEIEANNQGYSDIQQQIPRECLVSFTIPRDLAIFEPLYVYYEVEGFFQNHRRYVLSKNDAQLRDQFPADSQSTQELAEDLLSDCQPEESLFSDFQGSDLINYPCGLIAQSYFNDGIQLQSFTRQGQIHLTWKNGIEDTTNETSATNLRLDTSNVAWPSDMTRFRNPTTANGHPRYDLFQYIWQTYDQFSCYSSTNSSERTQCVSWSTFANIVQSSLPDDASVPGDGCAPLCVSESDVLVSEGGIPPPEELFNPESNGGVRFENFIVWMRTSALSDFRKLYGRISIQFEGPTLTGVKEDVLLTGESGSAGRWRQRQESISNVGFKQGDEIVFRVIPNFLVSEFNGKKKLVLSSSSPKDSNLGAVGLGYLVLDVIAWVAAIGVVVKMRMNPRKLGDPKYLKYKSN